jgi:glucose-1-phosphate cytidylyltransferase
MPHQVSDPARESAVQVVILCGGLGTRIREVDADLPKPMIPIGGRPILWHIMKGYAQHGYNDFVLCLGYKSWAIKRFFVDYHLSQSDFTVDLSQQGNVEIYGSSSQEDWRVTLVETGLNSMTGCRVKRIEKYITGEHFMLTYGDGVADVDVPALVDFHLSHDRTGTVTAVQPPGRFGEIELRGTEVVQFAEKPAQTQGSINGGFFVFHRNIFNWLTDDPNVMLEHEPLTRLAQAGELSAFRHEGFWHPMDNSRDYKHLNELWDSHQAPWQTWDVPARPRLRTAA